MNKHLTNFIKIFILLRFIKNIYSAGPCAFNEFEDEYFVCYLCNSVLPGKLIKFLNE